MECRSCHNDPHETKRACDSCHTPEGWSQTKTFDHTTTAFRIEGAHLKLKCAQCHQPSAAGAKDAWAPTPSMEAAALNAKTMATSGAAAPGAKESTAPRFSNAPAKCSGCHRAKEPHGGQFFEGGREEECSECHTMARFDKEDFRHERARFVPNSVHRNLQCPECHKQQREAAGRMIRVYRGTPTDCVQCHPQ
jgi:hypothetical protein